ncbi:MAG: prepilin-type N-terminal cleavage/methylation domain-containing protein [Candidatus Omnitrophota bacterium]
MNKNKGFTLIEVLVTTAVLAFGMVSIFQALFIIMNVFSYISHYLDVVSVADEKVWQVQDTLMRLGPGSAFAPQGEFDIGGKRYEWSLSVKQADAAAALYRIDLSTRWKEGRRPSLLERSAYAIYQSEEDQE